MPSPTIVLGTREAIAERLQFTRKALGLSQAELCRRTGIATNTWNNYEKALNRISLEEAVKVTQATGVSLDWIYLGVEAMLPGNIAEKLRESRSQERETA